ncbi:hypothetical protein ACJRO7_012532 [Eucalyptus globulus]|uniref:Transmembrane protein n=1 Tax=Eucalyptus globulus TaxID=34317 RepID=A0ABD3LIT8_EUCGL
MMEKNSPRIRWDKSTFLHTSEMIKSAIRLTYRNPTFIAFSVLASLPLFLVMLTHQLAMLRIFTDASSRLRLVSPYASQRLHIASGLIQETLVNVLQASLLYSVPALLLNLLTAVTTVHSASTIFMEGRSPCLRDMLKDSITKTRWKWPLITSTLVSFFSLISSVCIVSWAGVGRLFASGNSLYLSICGIILIVTMAKWLEYRAVWDVAIVLSISEDKNVFEALSMASTITKGKRTRGCVLMLLDFAWCFGLAALGFYVRGRFLANSTSVAVAETWLVCAGKVMKWVVCVVYCHDCKRRSSRDKVDLEGGEHAKLLRTVSS